MYSALNDCNLWSLFGEKTKCSRVVAAVRASSKAKQSYNTARTYFERGLIYKLSYHWVRAE
jgi:hypothetical protein